MKHIKFILFLTILIEITLFIVVGKLIGLFATLFLVILTFFIGIAILKHNQKEMVKVMQQSMQNGMPPIFAMMHNTVISLAAILLIVPGFFTDIIGLLLLIPKCQPFFLRFIRFPSPTTPKTTANQPHVQETVIDAECWHEEKNENHNSKND